MIIFCMYLLGVFALTYFLYRQFAEKRLITEGKTKKIWSYGITNGSVEIENKNEFNSDPFLTHDSVLKAEYNTIITCKMFKLLQEADIPVAYIKQLSPTSFRAQRCKMIPLKIIARRYTMGSYVERETAYKKAEGEIPHRFKRPLIEFFLKTRNGGLVIGEDVIVEGLDYEKGEENPFIGNPYDETWELFHSKKPGRSKEASLHKSFSVYSVIGEIEPNELAEITKNAFLVIEAAWEKRGYQLIDFKIKFGIDRYGNLLIADVIDNDSWRLRTSKFKIIKGGHMTVSDLTHEL